MSNQSNQVPDNVIVYYWSTEWGEEDAEPRALRCGDALFSMTDPDDDAPTWELDHRTITVDGHVYGYESRVGEHKYPHGFMTGYRYRRAAGWQVMVGPCGERLTPELRFPYPEQAKAEALAARRVTQNMQLGTALRAEIVWQEHDEYGDPVSYIDATDHTYATAIHARLAGEALPVHPLQEISGGVTAPPEDKEGDHHAAEPDHPEPVHCTTPEAARQVTMIVYYRGYTMPEPPTTYRGTARGMGKLVSYYQDGVERPFPGPNIYEVRNSLHMRGYRPVYTKWRVPNKRKRRWEIWELDQDAPALWSDVSLPPPPNHETAEEREAGNERRLKQAAEERAARGEELAKPWEIMKASDRAHYRIRQSQPGDMRLGR